MHAKKKLLIIFAVFLIGASVAYVVFNKDKSAAPDIEQQQAHATKSANSQSSSPPPVVFDKAAHSTSDPASIWIVANKQRPLNPKTYVPGDLVSVGGGQQLRGEAANALRLMIADASSASLTIKPLSGYRSYNTQVSVYGNEVKTNGQAVADSQSARPGYSEHQTGLAIDVGGGGCGIEDCFGNTAEGKWVAANAYKYGFIVRYVAGKEQVTGYRPEPWHIRYIGKDLSQEMHAQNIATLEEFFGLPAAPTY